MVVQSAHNQSFMKQKHFPVIGNKYNDWEVIDDKIYKVPSNRSSYWKVRCKCSYETLRCSTHLIDLRGKACKSCTQRKHTFEKSYLLRVERRAIKAKLEFDLDVDYIIQLLENQEYKCSLSGMHIEVRKMWHGKITQTASLDRIDNEKGYIKGNVQWLHKDINNMKYIFTESYFKELCKNVSSKCG